MQQSVQQQHIDLSFVESQMYSAIRNATPEQQAELRALSTSQSLTEFTRTLQQRFSQHAQYITEPRVANVMAYDRQHQAQIPAAYQAQPIATPTSQPATSDPAPMPTKQPRPKGRGFKYHFMRSTYITATWNWFMMFAAAACEAILTISVVYSCARLLPALHTPLWLDNTVFIWQMVALDVGGLSLRKMANQASKDGNKAGAKFASRVSNALITIMVLNVVLSVLQGVAKLDPQIVSVVEGILLVARAVMAVLYAAVIHSLREDDQPEPHDAPHDQPDLATQLAEAAVKYNQQLEEAKAEITRIFTATITDLQGQIKQIQTAPTMAPAIDIEAIARTMMPQLRATFQGQVRAITEEVQGQFKAMLIENQSHQARPLSGPEPLRQLEARATSQSQGQSHKGQPSLTLLNGSKLTSEPAARANGTPEERLQAAYDLLLKNSIRISGRSLAKEAHVNRDTASKWLAEVKGQQEEPEGEIVEADCEVEAIAQGQ